MKNLEMINGMILTSPLLLIFAIVFGIIFIAVLIFMGIIWLTIGWVFLVGILFLLCGLTMWMLSKKHMFLFLMLFGLVLMILSSADVLEFGYIVAGG